MKASRLHWRCCRNEMLEIAFKLRTRRLVPPLRTAMKNGGTSLRVRGRLKHITSFIAIIFTAFALQAAPKVSRIVVQPATVKLVHLRDSAQLTVTAHLADGRVMDVTHAAKYSLANPAVAGIESALLRPKAGGATEALVEYAGQRAKVSVLSEAKPRDVSFKHDTLPLLSKLGCSSGSCHGAPHGKGGFRLSLRAFDPTLDEYTLTREELGRRTNPLQPAASLLLAKPAMAVAHEGGRRFRKGDEYYNLLRDWIAEGCKVQTDEPTCVKLTVTPASGRVLKHPAWTQQLRVMAHFADGTQRDVTRLAVFESSDDKVADINRTGRVTGYRRGEAAVLVRYLEHIESVLITFVRDVEGFSWPNVPQKNYVDGHVDVKLRQLQFAPAGLCEDGTFVRRVHLDLIGTLPTIAETEAFIADKQPDKRVRLIDALLNRPEHAKFWALKWGDLLRLSVKQIGAPSVHKYHRWIESAIASNMPYDRFATSLLTARGSTLLNPPANFFRTAANRDDAVETSAQIFLGTRIACAKCHNHPFERWTQDNYYGMASFFNRIQRRRTSHIESATFLGHIHKPTPLDDPIDGKVFYPGSPQGLHISETGLRRFLVYDTETDTVDFCPVGTAKVFFDEECFIIPSEDEESILLQELQARLDATGLSQGELSEKGVFRFTLEGFTRDRDALVELFDQRVKELQLPLHEDTEYDGLLTADDPQKNLLAEDVVKIIDQLEKGTDALFDDSGEAVFSCVSVGGNEPTIEELKKAALTVIYQAK